MILPSLMRFIQGLGAVSADNLNTFEMTCNTFSDLRSFTGISNLQVFTRGGAAINDGLGGPFYWNSSSTSPDNNVSVIVPTGSLQGAWIRVIVTSGGAGLGVPGGPVFSTQYNVGAGFFGGVGPGTTTTVLHGNAGGPPSFGPVNIADLSATGVPSATTFLRGDNTWATPSAGSGGFGGQAGLTAFAGGGRPSATPITGLAGGEWLVTATVVASSADSFVLPVATAFSIIIFMHIAPPNLAQMFANGTDTINGVAGATGISIAPGPNGSINQFACVTNGAWTAGGYLI